jgi:pentatricopeptide repeat protein
MALIHSRMPSMLTRFMHPSTIITLTNTVFTQSLSLQPLDGTDAAIRALCRQGRLKEALNVLDGISVVDSDTYASLLEVCADTKALQDMLVMVILKMPLYCSKKCSGPVWNLMRSLFPAFSGHVLV